ncbi:hypothetical protein ES708_27523 [subsurface metagenome]
MTQTILIVIFVYVVIGVYKVVSDSRLRLIDKPGYIRNPKLKTTLGVIILWLPLLIVDLKEFGIKHMWESKKRLKGRNKRAKLERMMRGATAIDILSNKYQKARKEALEEIDKEKYNQ